MREAEVSEQTVYNYFQTKEQLVTGRDQLIQDELSRRIRTRAPGTTPAAAIRASPGASALRAGQDEADWDYRTLAAFSGVLSLLE